jgi:hypothetical protein
MPSFADQVRDDPVLFPNLEILRLERDQLGSSQATSNQDCKNCPGAFGSEAFRRLFPQQASRLLDRQPIANPDTQPLRSLHAADAGR